jgi:Spy/CpxP family protein refolding chaperone
MIARTVLGKILVFSIFFIGIATGAALHSAYQSRIASSSSGDSPKREEPRLNPQERAKRDQERMAQYLGLDPPQQEQIRKILDETRIEFKSLRDKTDPEFKALREKTEPMFKAIEEGSRARIRAVLNDEQRKKMDEFWAKRGNRFRQSKANDRSEKSDKQNKQ